MRDSLGLGVVGMPQQHGELVTAEAGEQVPGPQPALQASGDLGEQGVPGLVPERVVDLLEAVQVEQEQGLGGVAVREAGLGRVQHRAPVRQAGQVVERGLPADLAGHRHGARGDQHHEHRGEGRDREAVRRAVRGQVPDHQGGAREHRQDEA